jgi:dienelactone hydrolase
MVRHARPDSAPIAMTVYPGTHHAFDVEQLQPGRQVYGHWIEYNGAPAEDAQARVRTFLATHLEPAAAQEPTAK